MTYDEVSGNVVLFGGFGDTNLGDTWTWDGASWARQPDSPATVTEDGISHVLTVRRGAAMAFDEVTGKIVMFGGQGGKRTPILGDPDCIPRQDNLDQCLDISTVAETWTWSGDPGRRSWHFEDSLKMSKLLGYPDSRYGAAAASDPAFPRKAMLFGGFSEGLYRDDTWIWDGTSPADTTTTSSSTSLVPGSSSTSTTAPPLAPSRPAVRRLVPPAGSESGGTLVGIEGRGFTGATEVAFGDLRLDCTQPTVCTVSDERIQVSSPPQARGTVDVRVMTPAGRSAIVRDPGGADDQFTYFPPAPPEGVDTSGPEAGGFTPSQPSQPAPPGGFGSVPAPGGFSAAPGAGFSPTPGAAPGPAAAPTAPAAPAAPGAAPTAPAPATPGFVPPAASPPPAMTAGAPPEQVEVPGIAPHYNMVRSTGPGDAPGVGGPLGVAGGAMLVVVCFGASRVHDRRRPQAQPA
ncbi:MAG: IPT/TIG domain-containing protein [Acidimicrobiales bacterium]